jgi:hypothetical protein
METLTLNVTSPAPARSAAEGVLWGRLCDPEWLWFLGFGLLPAALCAGIGDLQRASFFFGATVYASVLKWLGHLLLGRFIPSPRPDILFPIELFTGLAVASVWFYLRNVVGGVWPASYSLRELAVLAPLLAGVHILAAVWRFPNDARAWGRVVRDLLIRAAVYVPFWGAIAVALWQVSGSLNPQTIDPIFHAFAARTYVETGLTQPSPFLNRTLGYPSGFGAINAVTMAMAPLTAAQTVNLQHVLWHITALFLLAVTPALLVGRWFRLLALAPLAFLVPLPLYALYPDDCYSGTPRQMAVALLPAGCVLALLAPARSRWSLVPACAVIAVLAGLTAAMNPACVPFAGLVLLVSLTILAVRAYRTPGQSLIRTVLVQTGLIALAALLILDGDPYYGRRLRRVLRPTSAPAATARDADVAADTPARVSGLGLSPMAGLRSISPLKVLRLADNATMTHGGNNEKVIGWTRYWQYAGLPALGLAAAALLAALVFSRQWQGAVLPRGVVSLAWFAAGCGLIWVLGKVTMLVLIGAITGTGVEAELLRIYLGFLLLRWDVLLLFAVLCPVGLALHLLGRSARPGLRLLPLGGLILVVVLLAGFTVGGWPRAGGSIVRLETVYLTTPNDVALVEWCNNNLPPEKGQIGMAADVGQAGPHRTERFITGVGGMPAFLLYGKYGNYRFTLSSLGEGRWYRGYRDHVQHTFDSDWCLQYGIRYFYVSPIGRRFNPALVEAIDRKQLLPVHAEGDSELYEVVGNSANAQAAEE